MEQTARRLVRLRFSPWSERAEWALDHHHLAYQIVEHEPFLGERRLRRLIGHAKPRATVPVLIDGDRVLTDSWDIALHADRVGDGSKLIPMDREAEIRRWNDLADETMNAGRALVLGSLIATPEGLDEGLPAQVPPAVRPYLRPVGRYVMRWFARKYGLQADRSEQYTSKVRAGLDALRAGLAKSSPYLLGSFSYADIVMATCLQGISPVANRYIPLGPGMRKVWTQEQLAIDFADLIVWRDRLYEQHRK